MTATLLLDPRNLMPTNEETELDGIEISGWLPPELNGVLLRNGPNPQFPDPAAHWFMGDGMLHAFSIKEGRARYTNRWIRTPKWKSERDAGASLFSGGFSEHPIDGAARVADSGTANTNIIRHAGRLLALEEGHLPVELDPASLDTRGYCDFGGRLSGPFTAHPKVDPVTGELLFFGYNASGPFSSTLSFGSMTAAGTVTRVDRCEAPFASMVHDFIVTENYLLFPILPLTGSMERARSGRPAYAWEPEMGSWLGVVRRDAPASTMRWFRSEACYVFHVMNAWEEGSTLVADVMQYERPPLFPHVDGSVSDPISRAARLCRWTVDLAADTDSFERRYTDVLTGEFPRIDERFAGRPNRHGWYVSDGDAARGDGLVHVDHLTGLRSSSRLRPGETISEPVFVPRSAAAAEADGWLLAIVTDAVERRSELVVYGATDLASGAVATLSLPHRVPSGFHGNWIAAA
jgi:carotenoid cleavage dioxygenase-like enzyme